MVVACKMFNRASSPDETEKVYFDTPNTPSQTTDHVVSIDNYGECVDPCNVATTTMLNVGVQHVLCVSTGPMGSALCGDVTSIIAKKMPKFEPTNCSIDTAAPYDTLCQTVLSTSDKKSVQSQIKSSVKNAMSYSSVEVCESSSIKGPIFEHGV